MIELECHNCGCSNDHPDAETLECDNVFCAFCEEPLLDDVNSELLKIIANLQERIEALEKS
jgi:hypothetical protein